MNDRELLELAAKAAGITEGIGGAFWTEFGVFDPLTDDGDALRLAVKLKLATDFTSNGVYVGNSGENEDDWTHEFYNNDYHAATRRAIVRAAAEIGRNMK